MKKPISDSVVERASEASFPVLLVLVGLLSPRVHSFALYAIGRVVIRFSVHSMRSLQCVSFGDDLDPLEECKTWTHA